MSSHWEPNSDFLNFLEITHQQSQYNQRILDLNPNQTCLSELVCRVMASPLQNLYPKRSFALEPSIDAGFAEIIERELLSLVTEVFRMPYASVAFSSGTQANLAAYRSFLKPGDKVITASIGQGGHESHQSEGVIQFCGASVLPLPFLSSGEVDLKSFEQILERQRPRLLILGTQPMLFPLPLESIKNICQRFNVKIMYDISAVSALVAAEKFQADAPRFVDMLTSSSAKSLHGPRHGFLLYQEISHAESIRESEDLLNSSIPVATMAALGVAFSEIKSFGKQYAEQAIRNAQAFARALKDFGFKVLFEKRGFTRSHAFIFEFEQAPTAVTLLEQAGISVQLSSLLGDWSNEPYHILLGTQVLTRRGMKEAEMEFIAEAMSRVLIHQEDPLKVRNKMTRELLSAFPKIEFAWDEKFSLDKMFDRTLPVSFKNPKNYAMTLASLADLPRDLLDQISESTNVITMKPGQQLFKAGEDANSVYFVVRGEVELWDEYTEPAQLVATLSNDESLGQKELLLQESWPWTARSKEETMLIEIPSTLFLDLLDRSDAFRAYFTRLEKTIHTQQKMQQQTLRRELDHLTGMKTRQAFWDFTQFELHRARRKPKQGLSMAYLDLLDFKNFNAQWGEAKGNEVLQVVSEVLKQTIRKSDVASRLEGAHFAILMPSTDASSAKIVSDRIQKSIQEEMKSRGWGIEFNIALVTFRSVPKTASQAMAETYHLMGDLKKQGRVGLRHEVLQ